MSLEKIFTDFANVTITEQEKRLFTTLVLFALQYRGKPDKIRAVMNTDAIVKTVWNILFLGIKDSNIEDSPQVFGKPGQSLLALATVQAAVERGDLVVCMDAVNAFPSLQRDSFMQYIETHPQYGKIRAFTNLMYSNAATARWFEEAKL
jgi:hypothetical protein